MMDCRCLHAGIDPSHDHENSVLRGLGRERGVGGGGGGGGGAGNYTIFIMPLYSL